MWPTLLLALLPAQEVQDAPRYAEVATPSASLRAFFDRRAVEVLEVEEGFPLKVVQVVEPWSKVLVPGGLDVWVHQDYVVFDGGLGTIQKAKVRIRPLPSTGPESHALGHYRKGAEVLRLGAEGDWVQVRYDGEVAVWIRSELLRFPQRKESQWQRIWQEMADSRTAVAEPDRLEEPGAEAETPGADQEEPVETGGPEGGAVDPEEASAKDGQASPSTAAEAEVPFRFDAAAVALDPAKHRARADEELEELSKEVATSDRNWDGERVDDLERLYGEVIWHSADRKEIEAARLSLTRIDGLRRFYSASLLARIQKAEQDQDLHLADSLIRKRDSIASLRQGTQHGTVVEVGWVEYHPKVNARIPFQVVRGLRVVPIHSFDGHHRLRDFRNREIVVRGNWREEETVADGKVLAITELRVLPLRRD